MAAVSPRPGPGDDGGAKVPEIAHIQSQQLLQKLVAAKPAIDSFDPAAGMADGGDVQLRPGLYTPKLIGPDDWPTASETEMARSADELATMARQHASANEEAHTHSQEVLRTHWTAGDGAAAAEAHYEQEYNAHSHLVEVLTAGSSGMRKLSGAVASAKRLIRQEHDQAHEEIEAYLKSPGPVGIAGVGPIVAKHRATIVSYAAGLKNIVAEETQTLSNKFGAPEAPPKESGGRGKDAATGDGDPKDHSKPSETGDRGGSSATGGSGGNSAGGAPGNPSRGGSTATPATPAQPSLPSHPSTPSLPSLPSGGSAASPLSGAASGGMGGPVSSLLGGGPAGVANNVGNPASSVQAQTSRAMQSAMGGDFGRGLMAGANAAGAVAPPPPAQPVPQAPASPLAAPMSSASPAAAPATVSAPTASAAPAAAAPAGGAPVGSPAVGGPGGAQMTSYGSVLPPGPAAGGAGPVPGAPGGLSGGAVPPGPVGGGGVPPGATGFVPVNRGGGDTGRVSPGIARSDMEMARQVVADLAAASSVVHPGLDWAVGVARGGQGTSKFWIATNEGLGYIPAGVYVPRLMPVVQDLDDGRWSGWFNPAETVVRAITARRDGTEVSAVATTFMSRSDLIDEMVGNKVVHEVAVGVPAAPGGPDQAEASRHLQRHAHRLETVAPALFHELSVSDRAVVDAYARRVTQQAVFGTGWPELSLTAQAVARAVLSGGWPSSDEWLALREEYSVARLMAGSQRPGVIGIEDGEQATTYQYDFVACQRLETLVCWERDSRADVVYAARAAGVPTPSLALINDSL